jgi:hypothetical protein
MTKRRLGEQEPVSAEEHAAAIPGILAKAHGPVAWAAETRAAYERLIGPLREVARLLGYALAVHGSLARYIDLIAVPWADGAVSAVVLAEFLIQSIRQNNNGIALVLNDGKDPNDETRRNPAKRPHGRLAWAIHLGGGPYIDLSVFPPQERA